MNKYLILIVLIFISYKSYSQGSILGGDKDKNGCINSAGYTYSSIKKNCIRTFEQELQLLELNPKTSTSIAAVIFNSDSSLAEVFLVNYKSSQILKRIKKSNQWKKGSLALIFKNNEFKLKKGEKYIYKSK